MKSWPTVLFLGALSLSTTPVLADHRETHEVRVDRNEEMNLAVGENRTLNAGDVRSYSEGVPGIAEVKLTPDGTHFVIVGQRAGTTTLLLLKKDGTQSTWNLNVTTRAMDLVEGELQRLLDGSTGLRLRRIGARFFIEGGVSNEAEQKRIQQIAALYPGQVESLVSIGGAAADRKINIRMDFYFVQYDRSKSYAFGMSWPTRIGGAGVLQSNFAYDFMAKSATSAQASVVNQPLPGLDIASRNGWAKVLKHSTVISSNGTEATFESGGEQNYAVNAGLTASIKSIPFGTNLTVLPRYDAKTRELQVKVTADVSDLTEPGSSTTLPGRTTSKLATSVELKLGQSLVLSGIRSRTERKGTAGIPLLSDIPILGLLFGSEAKSKEDVEGAVFVIPSVIESLPGQASDIVSGALAQYEKFSGDVDAVRAFQEQPGK